MEPVKGTSLDRALNHDDMNAARELEDEIERRGLQDRYAFAVLAQKETSDYLEGDHWFLLRATPEQRARAFMQVVDVQS